MSAKTQARREALREALVEAAERRIVEHGLNGVKARDLAQDAGCSVGAIYNVFDDLTALFMQVNLRSFQQLDRAITASQTGLEQAPPVRALEAMALAYLRYASENTNRWRALFDFELPDEADLSDWYLTQLRGLFGHIRGALVRLWPDRAPDEIDMMTRTLFASVHGITLLGLERRFANIPPEQVGRMISGLLVEIGNN